MEVQLKCRISLVDSVTGEETPITGFFPLVKQSGKVYLPHCGTKFGDIRIRASEDLIEKRCSEYHSTETSVLQLVNCLTDLAKRAQCTKDVMLVKEKLGTLMHSNSTRFQNLLKKQGLVSPYGLTIIEFLIWALTTEERFQDACREMMSGLMGEITQFPLWMEYLKQHKQEYPNVSSKLRHFVEFSGNLVKTIRYAEKMGDFHRLHSTLQIDAPDNLPEFIPSILYEDIECFEEEVAKAIKRYAIAFDFTNMGVDQTDIYKPDKLEKVKMTRKVRRATITKWNEAMKTGKASSSLLVGEYRHVALPSIKEGGHDVNVNDDILKRVLYPLNDQYVYREKQVNSSLILGQKRKRSSKRESQPTTCIFLCIPVPKIDEKGNIMAVPFPLIAPDSDRQVMLSLILKDEQPQYISGNAVVNKFNDRIKLQGMVVVSSYTQEVYCPESGKFVKNSILPISTKIKQIPISVHSKYETQSLYAIHNKADDPVNINILGQYDDNNLLSTLDWNIDEDFMS